MRERIVSLILGIIIILFFIRWNIGMIILPWASSGYSIPKDAKKLYPNPNIGVLFMHFLTTILALLLGVFLIVLGFTLIPFIFFGVFILSWIVYMIVFFTSNEYKIVTDFGSAFHNIYSEKDYNDEFDKWNNDNPRVYLRATLKNKTHVCQTNIFELYASSSIKTNNKPKKLKLDDFFGPKKGMIYVDLKNDITFTDESEQKIESIQKEILKCPQIKSFESKFTRQTVIYHLLSSLMVSQNKARPKKFSKSNVIIEGVFWAGARLCLDLYRIPFVEHIITKKSASFSDNYPPTFNCNNLNLRCWDYKIAKTCLPKEKLDIKKFPKEYINDDKSLFRDRLTRSYYLCQGTYSGDFTKYIVESEKKAYIWSKPIMDEWLVTSNYNGYARPSFYIGRHGNEIWVAIRGTHSLDDAFTDATFISTKEFGGCYHKGFYTAALNTWKSVYDIIRKYENGDFVFIFTGHSYGGAVANILHRFAFGCFPDLKDRMLTFTFGAPPAMGRITANGIHESTHSFINGDDIVPCLSSGYIGRVLLKFVLAIITLDGYEVYSQLIHDDIERTFTRVYNFGYQNDKIDILIGNIYHLTWKPFEKNKDLNKIKTNDYNVKPKIHAKISDHGINQYGKKFSSYKNGVMEPIKFDPNVRETEYIPKYYKNISLLKMLNMELDENLFNITQL